MQKYKSKLGFKRIIDANRYSWQGFKAAWHYEAAFKQELGLAVVLFPLGLWLGDGGMEKALLCAVVLLVLIVELLNSGIEAVVDRFGEEFHDLSGRAKDLASAAVFTSLALCALTWGLILWF